MRKILLFLWFIALVPGYAVAQDFDFRAPAAAEDAGTRAVMRDLAERLIPVFQDSNPERYLANISALQMAAGDYGSANTSREMLRDRRRSADSGRPIGRGVIYDIYAHAKALEAEDRVAFSAGFAKSYREVVPRLDGQDAYAVTQWLETPAGVFRETFQKALDQQRAKDSISQSEAVDLIWQYVSFDAYRSFGPLVGALDAEEDHRRYTVENDVLIPTPDGARISALVIRPNNPASPLPALLEFTIDDSQNYAKECAAHGYVGVVAYTRGSPKGAAGGPNHKGAPTVVPYQHDGDDARAVVDWIAKQPWSDGRVGMYGEGYSGFTAWAAAKHLPPALKAIAASAAAAPGISTPMEGNIFQNSAYRWSSHMTNSNASDEASYHDDAIWRALEQKWYRSGKRYRDLGRLYGKPNPIFIRWLNHPSYDRYWQKMIPYREEFAHIDIPVLTMTGYFAPGEPGDLYYFTQHHRYNAHADHTLIVGPYDDGLMRHGPSAMLQDYEVDAAAMADLRELRYQWFDHVLKGSAAPALLKDAVNYEVMGANEWQHAASLDAMADKHLRLYLDATTFGPGHRLVQRGTSTLRRNSASRRNSTPRGHSARRVHTASRGNPAQHKKTSAEFVEQTVNWVDRSDAGWMPPANLISKSLLPHYGTMFVSEPMSVPTEFSGLFSGRLDLTVNKMDVDLHITFYELFADGSYVRLFSPAYEFRASYAADRVHRRLLKAGERQALTFKSERITSRKLKAGSRLVMVLGIGKRPDREINYGTGNDVSEESVADGKIPLKIRWYGDSYVDVPVRR